MPRIVHFELPADDLGRAQRFYETVFGWSFKTMEGFPDYVLIKTGAESEPGINGALGTRESLGGTINTIDVPDIDAYIVKISAAGGSIASEKMDIPGVGYFVYASDTEGNKIGVIQFTGAPPEH